MTTQTPSGLLAATLILCCTNAVHAQNIDGLYQPEGYKWSCSAEQIGMDGGALAIQNDVFDGVENRCELTAPVSVGSGTSFTAACSAEGNTYSKQMTITPTANGVKIEQDDSTVHWTRCDSQQNTVSSPKPKNGRWVFGFGQGVTESSTRDTNGNAVTFTCNGGAEGGLYIELGGKPIAGGITDIDIDGQTFGMTAWAEGGRINTECSVCGRNYTALWEATAAGNMMTVRASDGLSVAFSLNGSRTALGDVVCQPDDGY